MDVLLLILRLLLAALLYGFLGALLVMLWRDLRRSTEAGESRRIRGRLIVMETIDETLEPGTAYPLRPITSIGRSTNSTVPLSDEFASAHHALLSWRDGQWWLEDQESRNGTWLNETRITSPTVVNDGDVITVGRTQLRLALR